MLRLRPQLIVMETQTTCRRRSAPRSVTLLVGVGWRTRSLTSASAEVTARWTTNVTPCDNSQHTTLTAKANRTEEPEHAMETTKSMQLKPQQMRAPSPSAGPRPRSFSSRGSSQTQASPHPTTNMACGTVRGSERDPGAEEGMTQRREHRRSITTHARSQYLPRVS